MHKPGIHSALACPHFSWLFVICLMVLLLLCDLGRANVLVYEGSTKLEEFPDIELAYAQSIRKNGIEGLLTAAYPLHACVNISKPPEMNISMNWFVLVSGGSCNFETKVLNAKLAGYSSAIIYTYRGRVESSNNPHGHRFYSDMPAIVIKTEDGIRLKENYLYSVSIFFRIIISPNNSFSIMTFLLLLSVVAGIFFLMIIIFTAIRFFQQSHTVPNGRLSHYHLKQLQTTTFKKGDGYETCAICLEDYKDQDKLRILPCSHGYHTKCIDPWLTNNRRICPVCKRRVVLSGENSNLPATETTPLLTERIDFQNVTSRANNPEVSPNVSTEHTVIENSLSTTVMRVHSL